MMTRFLNPKNDLVFKRLFGSEKHKDILIHFLNDIFARTMNPIEEVEFIKPVVDPEIKESRVSIVDVMCKDLEGNKFIVEMQCDVDTSFIKRAQYYVSKVYCSQRGKNQDYKDLKAVTFLAILDGTVFPNTKEYLTHHIILDKDSYAHELKDFSYSFLELKKFNKKPKELKTMIEKWAYFFKNAEDTSKEELPLIIGSDSIIEKAYEALEEYNYSTGEMLYYDQIERNEDVYKTLLSDAETKGEVRGEAKGKAAGLIEGKAAGIVEGEARGKAEVARKMKKAGIAKDVIKQITGIDLDEI